MEPSPVIRRLDHAIIRTRDPQPVYDFFHDTLGLPVAWPVTSFGPVFQSGGVRLGNLNLEILAVGDSPVTPRLYGLAFELYPGAEPLRELRRRGIPHTPPIPFLVEDQGKLVPAWHNVYLGNMMGGNSWMSLFFLLSRLTPQAAWRQASRPTAANLRIRLPLVFDRVFRDSLVMSVDFNPAWYRSPSDELAPESGGPLGILGVDEIIIGARRLSQARQVWQNLLAPLHPARPDAWNLECGITLRLISDARDELKAIVVRVRSVDQARQTLLGRQLLGASTPRQIAISPQKIEGLDIRLSQGREG